MLQILITVNRRSDQNGEPATPKLFSKHDTNPISCLQKNNFTAHFSSSEPHHDSCQLEKVSVIVSGLVAFADPAENDIAQTQGLARAIAHCYSLKRDAFMDDLQGEFFITLYDHEENTLFVATDRCGTHPVYYYHDSDTFICSNHTNFINAATPNIAIDKQSLYNYLYFHAVPAPGSILKNVNRLLPGQLLVVRSSNTPKIRQYWQPEYSESGQSDFSNLKNEFLTLLRSSIKRRMVSDAVGCFLSGGTDSSTIAGFANQIAEHPIKTFSIGFDVPGYDEIDYARTAATHFKTDHHEYYVTPADVTAAITKIAEQFDEPFGNSSAVPSYYCAKMAKEHGINVLLGGDGGDELFAGNTRYYKQHLFARFSDLPGVVRQLAKFTTNLIPFGGTIPGVKKVKSYINQAEIPMPDRMESYNLIARLGQENILHPEFIDAVNYDSPLELLRESYYGTNAKTMLNRMLALDLRFTLADNDLVKVSNSSHIADVDVLFPLLDDNIVAFANRLPVDLKLRGNYLRYFFKQALSEHLPEKIINKPKHGFGLPFGEWFKSHKPLYELTCDSLNALKSRHIVKNDFIDQLTNTIVSEHPGYYGNMVWILLMLEQWYHFHYDKP